MAIGWLDFDTDDDKDVLFVGLVDEHLFKRCSSPGQTEDFSSHASIHLLTTLLYILSDPLIRLLVLLLLLWLGSASDHRPHTPITTPFQYVSVPVSQTGSTITIRLLI